MKLKWLLKEVGTVIYDNRSNIEFIAGTALVVAGTVVVIKQAEKAVEVKGEVERLKKNIELTDDADGWESQGERTKACFAVAKTAVFGYSKTYGVGIGMELAGLTLQGISKATDRSEISSKTMALTSIAAQFAAYRQRVREDVGEEKEEEYYIGKPAGIVQVGENGEVYEETTVVPDHAFLFDETNSNYEKEGTFNLDFLESHEHWINERLWAEGFLWENDIRRDVNAPIDPNAGKGDYGITAVDDEGNRNYISFGLKSRRAQSFRDGTEKSFLVILNNMEPNITKKLYRLNKYGVDIKLA